MASTPLRGRRRAARGGAGALEARRGRFEARDHTRPGSSGRTAAVRHGVRPEPPSRIGPYVVEAVLGEGGMGTVYAARQEEPLERDVALKVLRASAVHPQSSARFEAEMHVLARLDHPYIARIFDAGTTDEGLAYFVMERIRGEPVTTYCEGRGLSSRGRLELFVRVLRAVAHAHQKAVVHRDLKPSNILVTDLDGQPVPKVIDFGIASVLSDSAGHAGRGADGRLFGTPTYMSPEARAGHEIDTRSDLYALGVLLHELLTGAVPCAPDVDDDRSVADLGTVRTAPSLPTDLRCILDKALAPDPQTRYASAAHFADDISRYLTEYPVHARAPTLTYRLHRFAARYRLRVLGATAAAIMLLAVTSIFMVRLAAERDRARIEAEKATEVAAFLQGLFRIPDPATLAPDSLTARELLDDGADRLMTELAGQPEVQASLLGVIGNTYRGLGLWGEAEDLLLDAVERERALKGAGHVDVAALLHDLGEVRTDRGDLPGAESALRDALEIRRSSLGAEHPETAHTMSQVGLVLRNAGELSEAEVFAVEAVEILRRAEGTDVRPVLALALHHLAFLRRTQERLEESEALYREALELRRALYDASHPDLLTTMGNLAVVLERRGRYQEAERLLREALEARRARLGDDHPNTLNALNNLAYTLWRNGQYARAEDLFREAIPIARSVHGSEHTTTAIMINNLGVAVRRAGDAEAAEALHREALAINRRLLGEEHPRIAGDLDNLGRAVLARGDPTQAQALHRRALDMRTRLLGADHPDLAESLSGLAAVRLATGEPEEAVSRLRSALALRAARLSPENPRVAETTHELGVALREAGDLAEAEELLRRALEARAATLDPGHPDLGVTRRELAVLLRETGRFAEADRLLRNERDHALERLGPIIPAARRSTRASNAPTPPSLSPHRTAHPRWLGSSWCPIPTAVTNPVVSTVATDSSNDFQVNSASSIKCPFASYAEAVSCCSSGAGPTTSAGPVSGSSSLTASVKSDGFTFTLATSC
ncbi:MAG: serine/threonine-protein kinase [Gemmatimonadota bacterium]|nr:serine/threonine-protein kinase [Gemmatimonadota bacterium]